MSNAFGIDLQFLFMGLMFLALACVGLMALIYVGFTYYRHRNREDHSLDSVLLQVAVPRNNEIKVDAMEQLFSALYSIKKGGWKQRFNTQASISFEIVAKLENITFYVWTTKKLQDLVEKQIHGSFPDAEILEVEEYNIFNKEGKVAFKSLQLRKDNFYPVKTFKDLPVDPMASLTSSLAKMEKQVLVFLQKPWKLLKIRLVGGLRNFNSYNCSFANRRICKSSFIKYNGGF